VTLALWHTAPGRCELRGSALGEGDLLVRATASAISRGTERLVHHGRVPESEREGMRCPMQEGAFPFPVKYGYCAVGVVEDGPAEWRGARVFALHPHQARFRAPAHLCARVPDGVPDARAALAANMETALNALWDAAPLAGERALVVGAGVVGLLVAHLLAKIPALDVVVTDSNPARRAAGDALGLRFAAPGDAPGGRELVVHATASEGGLRLALEKAAFEGRIVELSWFGAREPALPLGGRFHRERLRLVSSQVGSVSPAMRGRRTHSERLATALALLADARLDALLGPFVPFAELPARFTDLVESADALCPIITYD
jgi:NADPH:quinone reductase-like Zn-dependent oxidoreductase